MATYLDFNASTPILTEVLDYMIDIYRNHFGNSDSRTHLHGRDTKRIVGNARTQIAQSLQVDPMEVIFTSGSTESNNMAILGLLEDAQSTGRKHIVTTAIEHKSVLEPIQYLSRNGFNVDYINPGPTGRITPEDILQLVTDQTILVSIMHVNSETGIRQPIKEIGDALHTTNTLLHVDATQSFLKIQEELLETKYDMLSISSHKIRGPQGIGALILRMDKTNDYPIKPIMFGGSQQMGRRPGTVPVALAGGFGLAVEIRTGKLQQYRESCIKIKQQLLKDISGIPYEINGNADYCVPSTINISFTNICGDSEYLFASELKNLYSFSNGSACNTGSYQPSYVLEAMELEPHRIANAIRLSWDYDTKVDFKEFVRFIREHQIEAIK